MSRASNVHRKSRFSIAASGMPKSASSWERTFLTVGSDRMPVRTGFGTAFVTW